MDNDNTTVDSHTMCPTRVDTEVDSHTVVCPTPCQALGWTERRGLPPAHLPSQALYNNVSVLKLTEKQICWAFNSKASKYH